jgi:hypothetical protein
VKSPPIYESLRARMSDEGPAETNASAGKSE